MLIQNSRILLSNNIDVIFKTFWGNYSGYLKENSKIRCLVINTYLPWNFKTCEIKCYQNVKKKMWKKLLLYAVKIFKFQNPQCTCNTNKYKLIISLDSTCLQILILLLPYIAVLFELDKSRGTRPYVSVSMMTTRDTMTAGTPETNRLRERFIF